MPMENRIKSATYRQNLASRRIQSKRLGEILIEQGFINQAQLDKALAARKDELRDVKIRLPPVPWGFPWTREKPPW
jgi:hypothetical protein